MDQLVSQHFQRVMRYANKVSVVLGIAKSSGIKIGTLSRELGVTDATISGWWLGKYEPRPVVEQKFFRTMESRALYLSKFVATNESVRALYKKFGITLASLVDSNDEVLSCRSAEDLRQKIEKGIENFPEVKCAIQEHVRLIGRNLKQGLRVHD